MSTGTTPKLFQPFTLPTPSKDGKHITLSHRVVLAPLTRMRITPTEVPIPNLVKEYYAQRASSPGTLLITEGMFIAPKAAGFPGAPVFFTDEQINGWKEIVDAVHAKNSFIFLQLAAMGRGASLAYLQAIDPSYTPVAPSPIAQTIPLGAFNPSTPRALTEAEIQEYFDMFATAAKNAVERAGFDGVEIHGANGFLVDQFIQDVTNQRQDRWGGSIENRTRFALEVVKSISNAIGEERTALRLSPWSEGQEMGMKNPIPTFSYLVQKLAETHSNLAYLHVVEPRVNGFEDIEIDEKLKSNEFVRKIWAPRPLVRAGGYTRQNAIEETEKPGSEGVLVAFGRHFISNPDLPTRLKDNIPLNPYDRSTFYIPGDTSGKGYTDYPFAG